MIVGMEPVNEEEYFESIEGERVLRERIKTYYSVPFRGGEDTHVGVWTRQNIPFEGGAKYSVCALRGAL